MNIAETVHFIGRSVRFGTVLAVHNMFLFSGKQWSNPPEITYALDKFALFHSDIMGYCNQLTTGLEVLSAFFSCLPVGSAVSYKPEIRSSTKNLRALRNRLYWVFLMIDTSKNRVRIQTDSLRKFQTISGRRVRIYRTYFLVQNLITLWTQDWWPKTQWDNI